MKLTSANLLCLIGCMIWGFPISNLQRGFTLMDTRGGKGSRELFEVVGINGKALMGVQFTMPRPLSTSCY